MRTARLIFRLKTQNALLYGVNGRSACLNPPPAGLRAIATTALLSSSPHNPSGRDFTTVPNLEKDLSFDSKTFDRWPTPVIWSHWFSFWLCQFSYLVNIAPPALRLINHPNNPLRQVCRWLVRKTIYDQFVGGASDDEILETCRILRRYGIEPMLAVPIETETIKPGQDISEWHNDNTDKLVDCIEKGKKFAVKHKPVVHIKLTGIMDDEIFLKISEHIGLNITSTHKDSSGRSSQNKFEDCVEDFVKLILSPDYSCDYFLTFLTADELRHVKTGAARVARIGEAIGRTGTETLVDAEYIAVNPAITVMTLALARIYNTATEPLVGNTYQCYLKNASGLVDYEMNYLKRHGCAWTAKMVRGAYMVSEADRASKGGYENPICESKEATHANYDGIIGRLLDKLEAKENVKFLVASHNEDTIRLAVNRIVEMEKKGIKVGDDVIFAQLQGMCGHISSGLAMNDVPVYKALPIGGITDVLPYLARRAQENKTVLSETHRERGLLFEALRRRKFIKRRQL